MTPAPRVLHILAQRPELTGSGITLGSIVREAARRGWDQWVVCGIPVQDPVPEVGGLPADRIFPLRFGPGGDLSYPMPGMSDVMPYASTVWSRMDRPMLDRYRAIWSAHLRRAASAVQPDLVHVHHLWVVGAMVRNAFSGVPTVAHCHATGLRQLASCPQLASEVTLGNRDHDRVLVLGQDQAAAVVKTYGVLEDSVVPVGIGYRDDIFFPPLETDQDVRGDQVLYAGKFADAKGLPSLLEAVNSLAKSGTSLKLHVAGGGSGPESTALRRRMTAMSSLVEIHDQLSPPRLAELMRRCAVCVLPSFYEGLPLVLVEARASGCRLVATDVGEIGKRLVPVMGKAMLLISPPRLQDTDKPFSADLPVFTRSLGEAIRQALDLGPAPPAGDELATFTWSEVFARVERVWQTLISRGR